MKCALKILITAEYSKPSLYTTHYGIQFLDLCVLTITLMFQWPQNAFWIISIQWGIAQIMFDQLKHYEFSLASIGSLNAEAIFTAASG